MSRISNVAALGLGVAVLISLSTQPIGAQVHLAGGVGVGAFSGGDFEGSDGGPTVGAELRLSAGRLVQVGLGVDYSVYGIAGVGQDIDQVDVYLSGRRYTDAPTLRFYYGGKAGYVRQSTDAAPLEGSWVADGFAVGPVVGVQLPVGAVALEGGVDVLYHTHGAFTLGENEMEGSSASGFRWIARVGLAVPLGG